MGLWDEYLAHFILMFSVLSVKYFAKGFCRQHNIYSNSRVKNIYLFFFEQTFFGLADAKCLYVLRDKMF